MTTWMLVEDEPDLYDMLYHLISGIGHNVLGFMDGETAMHWIDSVERKTVTSQLPELALIDIRLPGQIHGPQIAARLRHSAPLQQMAVVLMTAYRLSPAEETQLLRYAMPDMMLYKPLPSFPEFRRRLEDLLM